MLPLTSLFLSPRMTVTHCIAGRAFGRPCLMLCSIRNCFKSLTAALF